MRRFLAFGPAFVVLLAAVVVLLVAPTAVRRVRAARTHAVVQVAQHALDDDDVLERINTATRNIALAVEPSVVHIDVSGIGHGLVWGSGSGWIFDHLGHIITNAHVVGDAREITIQFYDGHITSATVVGLDRDSDIAVLKFENGEDRVPARLASGQRLQIGDRVYSFGSPFGFKFSMSEGIVSGLGRSARTAAGQTRISNFIQTDAAVNPGNSGGPLVDVRGRVVGMNVAIANALNAQGASEGQSAGISFAIPLGTIESRVRQLLAGGPIVSGYLGVFFLDNNGRAAEGRPRGVYVDDVVDNGPADRAGMKSRDIVVEIDDQPVTDGNVLSTLISTRSPGEELHLKVWRDGKILDLTAIVAERKEVNRAQMYEERVQRRFGFEVADVDGRIVVQEVLPGSIAANAGLAKGQTVLAVLDVNSNLRESLIAFLARPGLLARDVLSLTVADESGNQSVIKIPLK